ncbi:MAG: hypothetical protein ABIR02_08180 [Novosphingobium sp.]
MTAGHSPQFEAMRDDLRARGLIDAEFSLTPAGMAFVDALFVDLAATRVTNDHRGARVRWRRAHDRLRSFSR